MASRESVDDVAREALLTGRVDRPASFLSGLESRCRELHVITVRPFDRRDPSDRQIPSPANVAIGMTHVFVVVCTQQTNQARTRATAASSGDRQVDGDSESEASPFRPNHRIEPSEDPILQTERVAPE